MDGYAVAHVDEIGEPDDGRAPMRPVRHHLGVAWIAREAGARIINEHDESEPDSNEELYLVLRGRASFEVDGERFAAPAGTFIFVRPGVRRTAFGGEPGTTIIAVGAVPGKPYEPSIRSARSPASKNFDVAILCVTNSARRRPRPRVC
jgi:quercetin dioxygenase-like cupin family protein